MRCAVRRRFFSQALFCRWVAEEFFSFAIRRAFCAKGGRTSSEQDVFFFGCLIVACMLLMFRVYYSSERGVDMALHENIKTRRTALKLSQEYVAERVGVSRQAVAKWETGKSVPAAAHLARLAEVLETSVAALAGGEHEERARSGICRNAGMLVGRFGGYVLLNAGWDGYASGLYTDLPAYWLSIAAAGLVLLLITSLDMRKRHDMRKPQFAVGALLLFSIFFLPSLLPLPSVGLRQLLSDLAAAACVVFLDLQYWRHIWKVK